MRRILVVNKHETFEQKVNLKIIYNQDCKRQIYCFPLTAPDHNCFWQILISL